MQPRFELCAFVGQHERERYEVIRGAVPLPHEPEALPQLGLEREAARGAELVDLLVRSQL